MKPVNFNFDINKYQQTNKIQKQTNPIKQQVQTDINKPVKVSCELLSAYNNVVSFKGEKSDFFLDKCNELCANEEEKNEVANWYKGTSKIKKNIANMLVGRKREGDKCKYIDIELERALSPVEAKNFICTGLISSSDVQNYLQLSKDFSSKVAISIIKYQLEGNDRFKLEALSQELFNGNRQLSQEEAIACLAYGFGFNEQGQIQQNHIKSFINKLDNEYLDEDGNNNRLNLFEAALCMTYDLDEDDIKRFFKIKTKFNPIKYGREQEYTLSTQEAVLLAKADLTNEELKRYAELKRKQIEYNAVRQHGNDARKTPSTELIISYIKNKNTDEEIAQMAKYGLKDIEEYNDFKNILKYFGYKEPEMVEQYLIRTFADMAKLQDENGKNIFKDKNGEFDFKGITPKELELISLFNISPSRFVEYIEIKKTLEKHLVFRSYDVQAFSALLINSDDEIKNVFKDKDGNYNFSNFDYESIMNIMLYKLNLSQIKDYHKILASLKTMKNQQTSKIGLDFDNINLYSLAAILTKYQDKEGKNVFLDENSEMYLKKFNLDELAQISVYLTKLGLSQLLDYKKILSELKKMPNKSNQNIYKIAIILAMRSDNVKNSYKDQNNNFCFNNFNIEEMRKISYFGLTLSEFNDYLAIISILKTKDDVDDSIEIVANQLAHFKNIQGKNIFKDDNGKFFIDEFDYKSLKGFALYMLTPNQNIDCEKIHFALKQIPNKYNDIVFDYAVSISKLPEEIKNTLKNKHGNFEFENFGLEEIEILSNYTEKQCQNYVHLVQTMSLKPEYAVHIARNEELMQRFKLLSPDIVWEAATGEAKSLFDLMEYFLKIGELNGKKVSSLDFDSNILTNGNEFNDGTLTYSTEDESKNYSVELEKISHNNTPVLIVKNKSGQRENYIAYDGAIALVRPLSYLESDKLDNLKQSLSQHPHFSIEQINALAKAAIHFIVDIIEDNGECIISKGINGIENAEPFVGKELDTVTTQNKFDSVLKKLHKDKNIKVEDIFRLMPKDAIIQIRPYATSLSSNPILYSISAEWEDKNGTAWQLRAHSDDLYHPNDKHNWVYRLGYTKKDEEPRFYCVEKDANENLIDTKFVIEDKSVDANIMDKTHVQFNMEPENFKENLISNPYFQQKIRNISILFNKTQEIMKIAADLKVIREGEKIEETKNRIIQKCQQNAGYYLKYKKFVDYLLNEKGLPPLSKTT